MDLNLQQMPCFCSKVVFWCIRRYEGWKSRVLGQLGCMEDENKVCFGSSLQEVKVVYVLQSFFKCKQRSVCCVKGLYMPSCMLQANL